MNYTDFMEALYVLWTSQKYEEAHQLTAAHSSSFSDKEIVNLFYLAVVYSCPNSPAGCPNLRPALPENVVRDIFDTFEEILDPNVLVSRKPRKEISDMMTTPLLNAILLFAPLSMIERLAERATPETLMGCNELMYCGATLLTVDLLRCFEKAGLDFSQFMLQFHSVVLQVSPFIGVYEELRQQRQAEEQNKRMMDVLNEMDCANHGKPSVM